MPEGLGPRVVRRAARANDTQAWLPLLQEPLGIVDEQPRDARTRARGRAGPHAQWKSDAADCDREVASQRLVALLEGPTTCLVRPTGQSLVEAVGVPVLFGAAGHQRKRPRDAGASARPRVGSRPQRKPYAPQGRREFAP